MARLLRIETCDGCPYFNGIEIAVTTDGALVCEGAARRWCMYPEMEREIGADEMDIPSWCPLPEADDSDHPLVRAKVRWDDPVLPEVGVIAVWVRTTLEDLHKNMGMTEPGTVYEVALAWCPLPEAEEATNDDVTE